MTGEAKTPQGEEKLKQTDERNDISESGDGESGNKRSLTRVVFGGREGLERPVRDVDFVQLEVLQPRAVQAHREQAHVGNLPVPRDNTTTRNHPL